MIEMPIARVAAAYAANRGGALALPTPAMPAATATESAFGTSATGGVAETDFGAFIDRQITQAVETLKESERVSMSAVAGKASAQEVVRSVLAAEMTVQSVVAIRDKMVQAYQEIMRMPV